MTTDTDLASWGEPPATPAEEALGKFIDTAVTNIEQGIAVNAEAVLPAIPELKERRQELARTLDLLFECAASVWENSIMNDDPSVAPRESSSGQTRPIPNRLLPDPFPLKYRIVRVLGEGQFGKVLLADDLHLGRQVALKTLRIPATSTLGPHVLAALRMEAQSLAQLDHPNIVRVHSWEEAKGDYYLVLQFVAGGALADRLKADQLLGWQEATRYVADVGEALVAAHARGVIHRDIKPENILWDPQSDEALLTDFGVSARLAEPGTVAGTPLYMAPEAFEGQVSPALDVYGLAATLYRLTVGRLPFSSASLSSLASEKLQGLPHPDLHCRAIPETIEEVIRAGMSGKPEDRPGMVSFVAILRGALNQSLADAIAQSTAGSSGRAHANLQLAVSRRLQSGLYESVATTSPQTSSTTRDMMRVPKPANQATVLTGEQVRVEVVADKGGYVTVFNIGPTGNLNLLYPASQSSSTAPIGQNRPISVLDVTLMPPAGRERLFAVWSREPLPIGVDLLSSIAVRSDTEASVEYQATRDMQRMQHLTAKLTPDAWTTTVLGLNHLPF